VVRRSRIIQIPDGVHCARDGTAVQCHPAYRQEVQFYDSNEWVDGNAAARSEFIDRCTRIECLRLYGNERCETGSLTSGQGR
jgi:hypothetical protein